MENKNRNVKNASMHIAAFVLGIISIISSLFWYVSLPSGVLAVVFGAKSSKKLGSKLGKAGLITGIIGLSLFTFIYISITFILICENL